MPGLAAAGVGEHVSDVSGSALMVGQLKSLKYESIPRLLSAAQTAPDHAALYLGALQGYVAADATLEDSIKAGQIFATAAYGALKRAVNSKANSVVLHELYFDGLAPSAPDPSAQVRAAIEQRFGSLDKWASDFIASAKDAAGWAMLVARPVKGRPYNVASVEHAYNVDYQNRKAEYRKCGKVPEPHRLECRRPAIPCCLIPLRMAWH